MKSIKDIFTHYRLSEEEILNKRRHIMKEFEKESINVVGGNLVNIAAIDIKIIFDLYDRYFFNDELRREKIDINFSVSNRMTSAAGKTLARKRRNGEVKDFEIRISNVFFLNFKRMKEERKVCGIPCKSTMESVLLIMEHEIIHVLEFLCFGESSCRKKRFQLVAFNLFHHTESYHALPNNREMVQKEKSVKLGESVSFKYKNELKKGILYKINKRAVVMVPEKEGAYRDSKGNRFQKYYVPVERLL